MPFLSFPRIDYGRAFVDTITSLFTGIQTELGPHPTATPNALKTLLDALFGGLNLGGISQLAAPGIASVPNANARLLLAESDEPAQGDENQSPASDLKVDEGKVDDGEVAADQAAADRAAADQAAAEGGCCR